MDIAVVGVVGCGLMGAGIAQVCAGSGYRTIVVEANDGLLEQGLGRIRKSLDDAVSKSRITPTDQRTALENLSGVTSLGALADSDLVIEAIVERIDETRRAYADIATILPDRCFPSDCTKRLAVS